MAEWKYLEEHRAVIQLPSSRVFGETIANDVDSEHGPLIALAPRMEAWMRTFAGRRLGPEDFARLRDEALAIFGEIDAARAVSS
jgi:hypothetical protein